MEEEPNIPKPHGGDCMEEPARSPLPGVGSKGSAGGEIGSHRAVPCLPSPR